MKILAISGSRADYGILKLVVDALEKEEAFHVSLHTIWGFSFEASFAYTKRLMPHADMLLVLGDRFEILAAATAAHLNRVPIAHIGGGDVTKGSYDDAMRDCISRMTTVHLVTSGKSFDRLYGMGYSNVHVVGSPAVDYILSNKWKKERPIEEPYVVVSYQAETLDGTNEFIKVVESLDPEKYAFFIRPNPDLGSEKIDKQIDLIVGKYAAIDAMPHDEFLNLIYHCDEFIGNSSSMLYEAPFFDPPVKCRMIGKRQEGRVIPFGDGHACERIVKILKEGKW